MRKIGIILLVLLCGCSPLKFYKTTGLSYHAANIYYNEELCARVSAVEIAYDNGKIVQEVTYIIDNPKYNHLAKSIIAYVSKLRPSWEVEVELKYYDGIYK
jgi:hypothetical protein